MVQSTGFPSITAAAEGPVTFGGFFYRWKARLLGWWGSSLAQGNAGGHMGPPLRANRNISGRAGEDTHSYEEASAFRNIGRGRSQTGPRAHTVRPYSGKRPGALVRQSQARL